MAEFELNSVDLGGLSSDKSDKVTAESLKIARQHHLDKLGLENNKLDAEIEHAKAQGFRVRLENKQFAYNARVRRAYAPWVFGFVIAYLLLATILMCSNNAWLKIHDDIMITFLGTTVVNVVGILIGVVRYFFPAVK